MSCKCLGRIRIELRTRSILRGGPCIAAINACNMHRQEMGITCTRTLTGFVLLPSLLSSIDCEINWYYYIKRIKQRLTSPCVRVYFTATGVNHSRMTRARCYGTHFPACVCVCSFCLYWLHYVSVCYCFQEMKFLQTKCYEVIRILWKRCHVTVTV